MIWPQSGALFSFQAFSWRNASSDEINFCSFLHRHGPVAAVALALKLGWRIERPLRELLATVGAENSILLCLSSQGVHARRSPVSSESSS
jgi:hypothetical protein